MHVTRSADQVEENSLFSDAITSGCWRTGKAPSGKLMVVILQLLDCLPRQDR
jgi:hypothetical protein